VVVVADAAPATTTALSRPRRRETGCRDRGLACDARRAGPINSRIIDRSPIDTPPL